MKRNKFLAIGMLVILFATVFLTACQPANEIENNETQAEEITTEEDQEGEEETVSEGEVVESEDETEEETTETTGPTEGGKVVVVLPSDPNSLDIHLTPGEENGEFYNLGSTLITIHPETNEFVPYLAESWTISEDGLVYTFKLREDVTFHNGDPLTAHDFVYTINRALDPEMVSPYAASIWAPVVSSEAVDDYTLVLTLGAPNFPFMLNLADGITQPLSQNAVEEWGEEYGRHPVGVGPYVFQEWNTGENIVYTRNPDYNWAPSFLHEGPAYIETLEFRIIPEYATAVAGLEAGEIDFLELQSQDFSRFDQDDNYTIFERMDQGNQSFVAFNTITAPFDNILVRKAFNLAVNRDALVTIVSQGQGVPLFGPITANTFGYDPNVENTGYHYNLEEAKALMEEAGYTYGEDGMLITPEGEPFTMTLFTPTHNPDNVKIAEVLVEQYKDLGVALEIGQEELGVLLPSLLSGDFQLTIIGLGWYDIDIMRMFYTSPFIGAVNISQVQNPELDELFNMTVISIDPDERQEYANQAQQYIIDQAYMVPLLANIKYSALNSSIQGFEFAPSVFRTWWQDAYITE